MQEITTIQEAPVSQEPGFKTVINKEAGLVQEIGLDGVMLSSRDMTAEERKLHGLPPAEEKKPAGMRMLKEAATERRAKVVALTKQGLGPKQIAEKLGVKTAVVYCLMTEARKKGELPKTSAPGGHGVPTAIQSRRGKVADLVAKGFNAVEIAKKLGVTPNVARADVRGLKGTKAAKAPKPMSAKKSDPGAIIHIVEQAVLAAQTMDPEDLESHIDAFELVVPIMADTKSREPLEQFIRHLKAFAAFRAEVV